MLIKICISLLWFLLLCMNYSSYAMASTSAKDMYLPAASRSTGAFGTDWKSDVRVFNPGTAAATVNITYMPMAQWASQLATIQVLVPGGDTLNMTNILEEDFGLTPNTAGALHFVSTANIYVESRIFTPDTDGVGTFGQRVPGIPANQAVATGETVDIIYIDNLSAADGFRTNFGLVDAGGTGAAYTLAAFNESGDPIGTPFNGTVGANQWDQYNALGKLGLSDVRNARLMFTVTSGKAIPYASQADNYTGDAMYIDGTKIKPSSGGECGSGLLWGVATQYLKGTPNWYWKDYINHPTLWTIADNKLLSIQDQTPELPGSGDEAAAIYINPPGPGGTMVMLGYYEKFANPILLVPGGTFELSMQFDYADSQSVLLSATWTILGSFECPNHISGTINAVVTAVDANYGYAAGSFDWHFEAGNK